MSAHPPTPLDSIYGEDGEPRRTLLIVDDTPMFREIETVFLARTGRIRTASDGTDALDLARDVRPDLVITDLTMQEMDGDEFCRQIRRDPDLRHLPVVIVTSGRSGEEHERAVRAGANDVLEKPLNRASLLQVVNRLLRLTVRGMERVPLETEVRLSTGASEAWAWSRNVSRGGMFVEAEVALEPDTEIALEFRMPESEIWVHPTARVVWRRQAKDEQRPGMGLQFLKLDRSAAQWLEQYVYELGTPLAPGDAPAA